MKIKKLFIASVKIGSIGLVTAVLLALVTGPIPVLADTPGSVGTWTTSPNTIPANPVEAGYVTANGYAYSIGGTNNLGNINNVSYAKLNSDGSTSAWTSSPNTLPNSLFYSSAVTANGYIYVLGGFNGGYANTVYYTKLNSDGSIGTWMTSPNNLPDSMYEGAAVTANGYMYFMGGFDSSGQVNTVYYTKLNSDGSIGTWMTSPSTLPDSVYNASAVTTNGYVYIIGGHGNSGLLKSVYYAHLNTDGTVGSWQTSPNTLPQAVNAQEAVTTNGYVYVMGGLMGGSDQTHVFYAPLNTDGTVDSWQTSPNSLLQPLAFGMAYTANSYIYYAGGTDGGTAENTVYSAFVTPNPIPTDPASLVSPQSTATTAPATGFGAPAQNNPVIVLLVTGTIISTGAGLVLLYRQKV